MFRILKPEIGSRGWLYMAANVLVFLCGVILFSPTVGTKASASSTLSRGHNAPGASQVNLFIGGFISDIYGNPLSNVRVTLTGLGGVRHVNTSSGYYNFIVTQGGNYTVEAASDSYSFSPPLLPFDNLSYNTGSANFTGTPVPNGPAPPLHNDDFDANNIDRNRWNIGVASQPISEFDPTIQVSQGYSPDPQSSGRFRIQPLNNVSGSRFNGSIATREINLELRPIVKVQMIQPATGNLAATIFSLGQDSNNYSRIMVTSAPVSMFAPEYRGEIPSSPTEGGQMIYYQTVQNGVTTNLVANPYNSVQQQFWRYRLDGCYLRLETSADGVTYTIRASQDICRTTIESLVTELIAGAFDATVNPGAALFDNYRADYASARYYLDCLSIPAYLQFQFENDPQPVTCSIRRYGRLNDTTTVRYATSDLTATAGEDYVPINGIATFLPGETEKQITVPIIDDPYHEGFIAPLVETFSLNIHDPVGGIIAFSESSTLKLKDNDFGNQIESSTRFAEQQYSDFLLRPADAAGIGYWSQEIDLCYMNARCRNRKRVEVSAAFFTSPEFLSKGGFAYSAYRAAFGTDITRIAFHILYSCNNRTTQESWELCAAYSIHANGTQPFFNLGRGAYIDTLFANVGVPLSQSERDYLFYSTLERQEILRYVANRAIETGLVQREQNRLFVLMQYIGYLSRDADTGGFNYWLGVYNQTGNTHLMVCEFITSAEYQQRFGPVVRDNSECAYFLQ